MSTMPVIFIGHGNPMNAITVNDYTRAWTAIGEMLGKPAGILVVSAHWCTAGTRLTSNLQPKTIHDFGGFPETLYQFNYPAPGSPLLARRVQALLGPVNAELDKTWGLDHGSWSVLCHLFPHADVPVVQLSLDQRQPADYHYDLGKRLRPLREGGILLLATGNIVHNLRAYAWGQDQAPAEPWAAQFEAQARELMLTGQDEALIHYEKLGQAASMAIPTPEHYVPLLYVLGARLPDDTVSFPVSGIEGGSISMLSVMLRSPH